jgi:cytoplasmic iron level regulating protein YaaA (DUF328/UPF0246 family)
MLLLLSPAKSLDYDTPTPPALLERAAAPKFAKRSAELIELLRTRSADDIAALMNLSPALAELNVRRYADWRPRFTRRNSKPALLAFNGDVYDGLNAKTLDDGAVDWAQQHLVMLSGLYGALKPLDLMQPYRLEMGTRLPNAHGADLYAYWGATVADELNRRLRSDESPVVVNLASQEYFRAADRPALQARVVECVFEDGKDGRYKVISFFAKRARGLMARYAATQRLMNPLQLQHFATDGYAHAPEASDPERWVFRRRHAA